MVRVEPVRHKKDLECYLRLPSQLYEGHPHWVPPLLADERKFHSPKHNEALQYSRTARWLAWDGEKPVGRIMGIINHQHNKMHDQRTGRFYQLDCINDEQVAKELIRTVENWAIEQGMDRIIGPFGFSDKDPQGIKIEGHEYPAVLLTPANPAYLESLIENNGYKKEIDCVSYRIPIPDKMPLLYKMVCDRIRTRGAYKLREFQTRKDLKPYIIPVLEMVNLCYADIFGFVPLSPPEIQKLAAQYLPILDPTLVKLVETAQGEAIGFVVSMPGITEGLQRSGGKLFPFGFIHLLKALQQSKQLVLLLGAVKPGHKGKGVTALLAESLLTTARRRGMTEIDSHLILENNMVMRAEAENIGGKVYKRFRVYQKKLPA